MLLRMREAENPPERFREAIERRLARACQSIPAEVDLSNCQIDDEETTKWAVDRLVQLEDIHSLNLRANRIDLDGLVRIADRFPQIECLNLNGNSVGNRGAFVICNRLGGLRSLDIGYNWIDEYGARAMAAKLHELRELNISHNPLFSSSVRRIVKRLNKLRVLNIASAGNPGAKWLAELQELTALDISENHVGDVEARRLARALPNLQSLSIAGNRLHDTGLEDLSHLHNLTSIDLSRNRIRSGRAMTVFIDRIVHRATKANLVGEIAIRGNPLQAPDGNYIDLSGLEDTPQPASEVLKYLRDAMAGDAISVPEARIVFIGTGENGKSQLAAALSGRVAKSEPVTERTKGVDVETLKPIATRAHGEVACRIFDCGGQPEQYQIHRAFWESLRNVMVVVVDACKPSGWRGQHALSGVSTVGNRVKYYLRMIEAEFQNRRTKPPPVVIILTFGDMLAQISARVDERLRSSYPTIQSLQLAAQDFRHSLSIRVVPEPVDALGQTGLGSVREALAAVLEATEGLSAKLPRTFGEVRRQVQSQFGTFEEPVDEYPGFEISFFNKICVACGEADPERPPIYLRVLAALGDVIHDQVDPTLSDSVLNTQWARKALYEILTHELVRKNHGYLTEEELSRVLPRTHGQLVRQLSESLQIIFRIQGKPHEQTGKTADHWLVPQALAFKERAHDWVNGDGFLTINKGRFLAEAWFLHQLGRFAQLIERPQTEAFRDEVVFTEPSSRAKAVLRADYESDPMGVHFYANPEDRAALSQAWCVRLYEHLTGETAPIKPSLSQTADTSPATGDGRMKGKEPSKETLAIAYLIEHPHATFAEIAREVGVSPSTFSTKGRWEKFHRYLKAVRRIVGKDLPRGVKDSEGNLEAESPDDE